jgi:GcrA cell cycle regulator
VSRLRLRTDTYGAFHPTAYPVQLRCVPIHSETSAAMGVETWTQEQIDLAISLWRQGVSGSIIGARLGKSRCSVLGKLHRLKLTTPRPTRVQRRNIGQDTRKERQRRARELAAKSARQPTPFARLMAEPFVPRIAPVAPLLLDIRDLGDDQCRYPCTDGPPNSHRFCGVKKVTGLPYCGAHARICFVPPNPARIAPRGGNTPHGVVNGESRLYVADTRSLEVVE